MKIIYNGELKTIDTEQKAYLLGLFYSDGCVSSNSNLCSITGLKSTTLNTFHQIIKYFPFFKINNHSVSKINGNQYITLLCVNKMLKNHLLEHGLLPRKSIDYVEQPRLPLLDDCFYGSFLRGFWDGDGYFIKNDSRYKIKCGISSVNYYLLCDILKLLFEKGVNLHIRCRSKEEMNGYKKKYGIISTKDIYEICTLSFKELLKLVDFLYKENTIFIKYKKEIAESCKQYAIEEYNKYLEKENVPCPKCNHYRCTYNGIRGKNPKRRMKCSVCKHSFTVEIPNIAPDSSNIISAQNQLIHKE